MATKNVKQCGHEHEMSIMSLFFSCVGTIGICFDAFAKKLVRHTNNVTYATKHGICDADKRAGKGQIIITRVMSYDTKQRKTNNKMEC